MGDRWDSLCKQIDAEQNKISSIPTQTAFWELYHSFFSSVFSTSALGSLEHSGEWQWFGVLLTVIYCSCVPAASRGAGEATESLTSASESGSRSVTRAPKPPS